MINILDDRSEGEIGANIELGQSVGELRPSLAGNVPAKRAGSKPRYSQKKDERPLAQTHDYEGGLGSSSKMEHEPIYDSKEDPIPKAKRIGGNKGSVFVSGDSFGQNPMNRSSGHEKVKRGMPHRDQIAEDFLENDDDLQESGEINPSMFR